MCVCDCKVMQHLDYAIKHVWKQKPGLNEEHRGEGQTRLQVKLKNT